MRPLDPRSLPPVPWKNGGGVTREIAGEPGHWRLSLAEVSAEGPFSLFPGQMRILTVVDGSGMELHTDGRVLRAQLAAPLRFSGDLPVTGRLPDGPVRNLNLIFDPRRVTGSVSVHTGARTLAATPEEVALYLLSGTASCQTTAIAAGQVLCARNVSLKPGPDALALCVTISRRT
ncbi:HutD family protein [Ruegeria pomeroyi]|uniref:HutD/Ves family protein n=1 Tax=Ruegeria pomeroyi TaxID=89184 RepID=UPI001F1655AB|nr:HutD family protein [Ruegeria pomeroyi]MCE8508118.1 HutD family protein [Ruegeria pomeroyi]